MTRICEYLVFTNGNPQFIMYARTRTKYEDALCILNKHLGHSLTLDEITMKSRTQVSKKVWKTFVMRTRGGRYASVS